MKQKIVDFINIFFGLRKFIIMMGLFVVGIAFRIKGYVDGAEFVDLLKSTTISFFAANSGERLLTTVQSYMDAKNREKVPSDNLVQADEDDSAASVADAQAAIPQASK